MAGGFVEFLSQDQDIPLPVAVEQAPRRDDAGNADQGEDDAALSLPTRDVGQVPGLDKVTKTRVLVECAERQQQLQQLLAGLAASQDEPGSALSLPTCETDVAGIQTRLFLECTQRQEQLQRLLIDLGDKMKDVSALQEHLETHLVQGRGDRIGVAQWLFVPPLDKSPTAGEVASSTEEQKMAEDQLRKQNREREEVERFQLLHCMTFWQERFRYMEQDEEEDEAVVVQRAERRRQERQRQLAFAGLGGIEPQANQKDKEEIQPCWVRRRGALHSETGRRMLFSVARLCLGR